MALENLLDLLENYARVGHGSVYSRYFDAAVIFVLFYALSQLVVFIFQKIFLRLTKKTKTEIDDQLVHRTSKPISLILIFIGIRLGLLPLGLNQSVTDVIENILGSVIIVVITYIAIVVLDIVIDNWGTKVAQRTKSSFDDELIPIFHRFSRIFISIVGLLFILPVWGIEIGPLLASLGIAGIAVAFALQNTLNNIFGGVSIILDKSIKVGDKIKLDNDTMGTVLGVGLRSTKIKTWDNEVITVPNGRLADSKILNFIQPDPSVRVMVPFGVEYGSDVQKVKRIVLDTLSKMPKVLKEPAPKVQMDEMADFSLKFKALFWVNNFDIKFDTKAEAVENIYNALKESGIGIPFPTSTVYLKK